MYSSRNISSKLTSFIKKLTHHRKHAKTSYQHLAVTEGAKAAQRGCVAMYVEGKRYEVPLKYLSSPAFRELLLRSQGYDWDRKVDGPIEIPCSTQFFEQFLKQVKELEING